MGGEGASSGMQVAISLSRQGELSALARWLRTYGSVDVVQTPGVPGSGEQGALDVLTVVAGSSGLLAAVKVLPEFLRSRRSGLTITMTVRGEPLTLNATNVDDVLPILERLLND